MEFLFMAMIIGMLCGAVPMIYGAVKGEFGLGLTGFFVCAVSGIILGLLLAIPMAGLFTYLISKRVKAAEKSQQ